MGVEQKDSLLLEPNRRILYSWSRTEEFFTIGADQKDSLQGIFTIGVKQKDSLLLEPNRRILYCWRRTILDSLLFAEYDGLLDFWLFAEYDGILDLLPFAEYDGLL